MRRGDFDIVVERWFATKEEAKKFIDELVNGSHP